MQELVTRHNVNQHKANEVLLYVQLGVLTPLLQHTASALLWTMYCNFSLPVNLSNGYSFLQLSFVNTVPHNEGFRRLLLVCHLTMTSTTKAFMCRTCSILYVSYLLCLNTHILQFVLLCNTPLQSTPIGLHATRCRVAGQVSWLLPGMAMLKY